MKNRQILTITIMIVKIKKRAIKGMPAGCIGVKTDVLIESRMFIYYPVEIYIGIIIIYIGYIGSG